MLGETALLVLLLRALGALKIQGQPSHVPPPAMTTIDEGGLAIGEIAPSFAAQDGEGNNMQLAETDGRSRLLIFLQPGCSACANAIVLINALVERDPHIALSVFGLADQDANKVYAEQSSLRVPLWTPSDTSCEKTYGIRAIPFAFVLDERRVIQAKGIVSHQLQFEQLLKFLPERVPASL
ncbi:peroxiredoxin family protein [Tengunoibacter tsumagoiensis]|uniref:peroxiredoxin family protein n=1 Tax=Tengunoibacter tsumagoiensis TaxID=2014871 RepID=UPI0013866E7A|nr:redoxin domain-containing protein [Tengunoibacter tsumagoiensis]